MPAAAIIGAGVIGAGSSIIAGNKAAKAQKDAASQQIAYQREKDAQDRADLAPWRKVGEGALAMLAREYGLSPSEQGGPGSAFVASPGYQFRLDEGVKAAERSAAARGLLGSGAAMKAVQRYGEGLAAEEYGNWWNRGAGLAGVGQAATNTGIAAGQASTNNIMQAYQNMGNARASSYANTGSAVNQGINNVLSAYLFQRGGGFNAPQMPGTTPPYGGY